MKNRFVKNLFQTFSVLIFSSFLVFILVYELVFVYYYDNVMISVLLIISIFLTVALCFAVGFQIVIIDEHGLTLYFISKKIRQIYWSEIETIEISNVLKSVCYTLHFKNSNRSFNLDFRRSIKNALLYYAPKDITRNL